MTKRHNAKYKIDRRLGVNLWGDLKALLIEETQSLVSMVYRDKERNLSDYGNQLFAKQKLKFYYGDLTERQFRNILKKLLILKVILVKF